jgi:hypothetical protein
MHISRPTVGPTAQHYIGFSEMNRLSVILLIFNSLLLTSKGEVEKVDVEDDIVLGKSVYNQKSDLTHILIINAAFV